MAEETAEAWFEREHGDCEGPFCREEMLAAFTAGQQDESDESACDYWSWARLWGPEGKFIDHA